MELRDLTIGYGRRPLLTGISATLRRGQFVCLTGRNGTGKSTLLKTLAGILSPLGGEVWLEGRPLADYRPAMLARQVGLVLTHVPELPNTTLRELVAYGRLPYLSWCCRPTADDLEATDAAIRTLGITALADRQLSQLSDGERQKAMIARALAQGTHWLLLDEPAAFLDYESRLELMQTLTTLAHDAGRAVLLSSHDLDLVRRYADTEWHIEGEKLEVRFVREKEITLCSEKLSGREQRIT